MSLKETNYTSTLASALDAYLQKIVTGAFERAYTPNIQEQAFNKLNTSKCFDLIKRINESLLLILEIKITDDKQTFRSYSHRQHIINKILRKVNIPIEYCYNLVNDYSTLQDEEVLIKSNTSEPNIVCDESGNITNLNQHRDLKSLIDSMLEENDSNGDLFNGLLSRDFITNLQDSNIQLLFFAYNANNKEILTFNTKDLVELYSVFSKEINNEIEIDFKTANTDDIKDFFIATQSNIKNIISNYIFNKLLEEAEGKEKKQTKYKDLNL